MPLWVRRRWRRRWQRSSTSISPRETGGTCGCVAGSMSLGRSWIRSWKVLERRVRIRGGRGGRSAGGVAGVLVGARRVCVRGAGAVAATAARSFAASTPYRLGPRPWLRGGFFVLTKNPLQQRISVWAMVSRYATSRYSEKLSKEFTCFQTLTPVRNVACFVPQPPDQLGCWRVVLKRLLRFTTDQAGMRP